MIPKIIHYCWFGRGEKKDDVKKYIATWHKLLPDYTIIEWNEDNYDVNACRFSREAYEKKQYAFVSDYARLDILSKYGGIYFDVDMELIKPIDTCLRHKCFFGYEGKKGGIATCVIGCEAHNNIIEKLKLYYESIGFINKGKLNNRPNTLVVEEILKKELGCEFDGIEGQLGEVYFYDWHVFHPLSLMSGKLSINEETLAIHRHTLLWISKKARIIRFIRLHIFIPIFGEEAYRQIEKRRRR